MKEHVSKLLLERSDLKRRVLEVEEARRRSSAAVEALQGQKARLEEELSHKASLVHHAWGEKDKFSDELHQAKTRIWTLEQEAIKSQAELHHVRAESTATVSRCIEAMGEVTQSLVSKSKVLEDLQVKCQTDAKEIARLRTRCSESGAIFVPIS